MAYVTITDQEIEVGEPTAKPLFDKIKDNLDDHEDRLGAIEVAATSRPPIDFGVFGIMQAPFAYDGLLIYRTPIDITATGVRLLQKIAGASGTLTVDIEYKRGGGAWTSILTGPISLTSADGDLALESGVLAITDFLAGDLFRLNVDSVQADQEDFIAYIENEVA